MVSSAYLRLLIFLQAILIPACASSSPEFVMMSSEYKLNKQGHFSYLEPVCCSMSSSNCCFLTCIEVSQEAGQVVWYSHLFQNFPQFIVIHIVKRSIITLQGDRPKFQMGPRKPLLCLFMPLTFFIPLGLHSWTRCLNHFSYHLLPFLHFPSFPQCSGLPSLPDKEGDTTRTVSYFLSWSLSSLASLEHKGIVITG